MEKTQLKIKDFYVAAFLVLKQCPLVSYFRENGATTFIFENSDRLQQLVNDFNSLQGICDALSYSSFIRNLKTIIHYSRSTVPPLSTVQQGELNNEFYNNVKGK
jgi:Domain of unknown function (DUF5659)